MTHTPPAREDGRETPETDAIYSRGSAFIAEDLIPDMRASNPGGGVTSKTYADMVALARRLERERDAAREAYAALIDVHRGWCNYCQGNEGICLSSPAGGCSIADHRAILDRGGEGR